MQLLYTLLEDFVPTEVERGLLLDAIPSHARSRIAKLRRIEDQNRSLLGWSLLIRWMRLQGHRVSLKDAIKIGTHGKPGFAAPQEDWTRTVGFNIAHDDGLVVCAVHDAVLCERDSKTHTPMVGVDCMRLDRPYDELLELDEVLMDQLTVSERAAVPPLRDFNRTDDGSRRDLRTRLYHLLTLWTVKEAYIKALGQGLSMDLKRIDVSFSEDASSRIKTSLAQEESRTEDHIAPQADLNAPCHLCQGAVKLALDGLEIQTSTTSNLRWHMQRGTKRIDDEDVQSGYQEYVWACVWATAVQEGCGMEEMMVASQKKLQCIDEEIIP